MSWSHISNSFFQDNGRNYSFIAALYSTEAIDKNAIAEKGQFNDSFDCELDIKFVKEFEYETSLNSLFVKGSLTYVDERGICANLINNPYEKLAVLMHEVTVSKDGLAEIKNVKAEFIQTFVIEKVVILKRSLNSIAYRFELVSDNYLNLASIVQFSNYNNSQQDIFSILKECFSRCKIKIDENAFNNVTSRVALKYATNVNDNCISIARYLFNKLYFYSNNLDDSLKYIYYDELNDTIKLYDLKDDKTYGKHRMCVLDIGMKSSYENLQKAEYIDITSVNRVPTTDFFNSLMTINRYSYSFIENKISNNQITNQTNIEFVNNFPKGNDNETGKFNPFPNGNFNYATCDSEWNSFKDLYHKFSYGVIGYNSIVLNLAGQIDFKPSYCVDLGFPVDVETLTQGSDSQKLYEQFKSLCSDINGIWRVSKVHHILKPSEHKYKQNVIIFRNTKNTDNSKNVDSSKK